VVAFYSNNNNNNNNSNKKRKIGFSRRPIIFEKKKKRIGAHVYVPRRNEGTQKSSWAVDLAVASCVKRKTGGSPFIVQTKTKNQTVDEEIRRFDW
jgi:hypothetical protein